MKLLGYIYTYLYFFFPSFLL